MEIYIVLALIVSFLWGTIPVIHKYLLTKYQPITIMLLSNVIYLSLLLITLIFYRKVFINDINKMSHNDIVIIVVASISGLYIAYNIYYYILKDHKSSIISALIYSSPIFTLIVAYLFLKERLSIYGYLGIFSILLGVIFISQN